MAVPSVAASTWTTRAKISRTFPWRGTSQTTDSGANKGDGDKTTSVEPIYSLIRETGVRDHETYTHITATPIEAPDSHAPYEPPDTTDFLTPETSPHFFNMTNSTVERLANAGKIDPLWVHSH